MIETVNFWAKAWAGGFLPLILQNTVFLAILLVALHFLRNRSARIRYGLALLGLIKCLLPPFLPFTLQSSAIPQTVAAVTVGAAQVVSAAEFVSPGLNPTAWILALWLAGVVLLLLIPAVSTGRLKRRLDRSGEAVPPEQLPLPGPVKISFFQSSQIHLPLSLGPRPKRIYLPVGWRGWPPSCQRAILRHELEHIRRRDGLVQTLQILVRSLYFFHPLVWLLNRKMDEYREMACDDAALAGSRITPLEYARLLVRLADRLLRSEPAATSVSALMKGKNKLFNRVNYQIKEVAMKTMSRTSRAALSAGFVLLMIPFSFYLHEPELAEAPAVKDPAGAASADAGPVSARAGNPARKDQPAPASGENSVDSTAKKDTLERATRTGKIYGKVMDAESGEPLPGTNILVRGTTFGAAADLNGSYFIINLPPGIYMLEARMMGYANVLIQDVRVAVAKSTELNFKLKPQVLKAPELTVPQPESEFDIRLLEGGEGRPAPAAAPAPPAAPEPVDEPAPVTQPAAEPAPATEPAPAPEQGKEDDFVFIAYDKPPEPVGGFKAIQQHLEIPPVMVKLMKEKGFSGRTDLHVVIEGDGSVSGTKIVKSCGVPEGDQAAVKAVSRVQWKPALQRDKPVKVVVAIPVVFHSLAGPEELKKRNSDDTGQKEGAGSAAGGSTKSEFIVFDTLPEPVGGYAALQRAVPYPELAVKAGVEGQVMLKVHLSAEGDVFDVQVVKSLGNNGCDEAAIKAVKSVKWLPATNKGDPVEVWTVVPVNFKLNAEK